MTSTQKLDIQLGFSAWFKTLRIRSTYSYLHIDKGTDPLTGSFIVYFAALITSSCIVVRFALCGPLYLGMDAVIRVHPF